MYSSIESDYRDVSSSLLLQRRERGFVCEGKEREEECTGNGLGSFFELILHLVYFKDFIYIFHEFFETFILFQRQSDKVSYIIN